MTVTIEHGQMTLDVAELLRELTPAEKRELATDLAIVDDVIADVARQIIDGYTTDGSHGWDDSEAADPHSPLGQAIREVALWSDSVAARQVAALTASMRRQHAYHEATKEWAWTMYHTMADAHRDVIRCPLPPASPSAYDTRPDAYIVVPAPEDLATEVGQQ